MSETQFPCQNMWITSEISYGFNHDAFYCKSIIKNNKRDKFYVKIK